MLHDTPLISTIVAGLVLAFVLGAIAHRLRLPPLVGYLVAGIFVGPHTPGFIADQTLAPELAEIGVILLMFGVGLHFSLKDLMSVRFIALPGAVFQMGFATLLGWVLGWSLGWSAGGSLVFGLALSVASTVVLLKALQERRLLETERGKVAVGWLIVEDLAMVLVLVLIPAATGIATGEHGNLDPLSATIGNVFHLNNMVGVIIGVTLFKVVLFVLLMLVVGRKLIPWILHRIAHSGSRELFRLGVLAIALGVAFGAAKMFGVSLALGAFFAGMVLSESPLSHRAAQESLPLRDAFAVLFFVSVGMLFDPGIIFESPLPLLATVAIIVLGKSIAALVIVLAFRRTAGTALTIAASLAQIGEFSFILAGMGTELKLLPQEGTNLILAGAIISIILNPLVFWACDRLKPMLEARLAHPPAATPVATTPAAETQAETAVETGADMPVTQPEPKATPAAPTDPAVAVADTSDQDDDEPHATSATGHTILVGYGRVGHIVGEALKAAGRPLVVIEDAAPQIRQAQAQGIEVITGNAASADILALANLAAAHAIVVAIPESFEAGQVVTKARNANPAIQIVGRAHSDAEVTHLTGLGATTVIMGEREIARGMLEVLDYSPEETDAAKSPSPESPSPADPSLVSP